MDIVRNAADGERIQICTKPIFDKRLSAKAKGLIAYLLMMPPGWNCSLEDIERNFTDGRESIRTAMLELEKNHYLQKEQMRENGRFIGYEYRIYEKSQEKE